MGDFIFDFQDALYSAFPNYLRAGRKEQILHLILKNQKNKCSEAKVLTDISEALTNKDNALMAMHLHTFDNTRATTSLEKSEVKVFLPENSIK